MTANGLITLPSAHGAKATVDRLAAEVAAKGMTVFARIDHAAGAKEVGMALRPTEASDLRQCQRRHAADAGPADASASICR